jgi:LSD1 subclass zinc finger protein
MWLIYLVVWTSFAVLASLIAQWKNRSAVEGFLLGLALGVFGAAIEALLPRGILNLGPGRYAVRCPVCNAVQNVADADNSYNCWQCHQPTILHTVDDGDAQGRHTVECPTCAKKMKVTRQGIRYTCSCGSRNNLAIYV